MAIKDVNGDYYKNNYAKSYVMGNSIYCAYDIYKNENERDKEKIRKEKTELFFKNFLDYYNKKYNELLELAKEKGLTPESEIDVDNFLQKNVDVKNAKEFAENILEQFREIREHLTSLENCEQSEVKLFLTVKELEKYGFKEEWVTDPVIFKGSGTVYCGEYAGEQLSKEFYYNHLKTIMNENIVDV